MTAENGFVRVVKRWSLWFNFVAYAGCALMLSLSVVDIVGSKIFSWPLPGGADVIGLIAVLVAALPIAATELSGGHVRLDLVLAFLPKKIRVAFRRIGTLLSLVLFLLIAIASMKYGLSLQNTGEASMTVAIPFFPFVYAIVLACIPTLLVLIIELFASENAEKEGDQI
jgi:TRAP-type C4-dicarboxylate transport system permease small subunit